MLSSSEFKPVTPNYDTMKSKTKVNQTNQSDKQIKNPRNDIETTENDTHISPSSMTAQEKANTIANSNQTNDKYNNSHNSNHDTTEHSMTHDETNTNTYPSNLDATENVTTRMGDYSDNYSDITTQNKNDLKQAKIDNSETTSNITTNTNTNTNNNNKNNKNQVLEIIVEDYNEQKATDKLGSENNHTYENDDMTVTDHPSDFITTNSETNPMHYPEIIDNDANSNISTHNNDDQITTTDYTQKQHDMLYTETNDQISEENNEPISIDHVLGDTDDINVSDTQHQNNNETINDNSNNNDEYSNEF